MQSFVDSGYLIEQDAKDYLSEYAMNPDQQCDHCSTVGVERFVYTYQGAFCSKDCARCHLEQRMDCKQCRAIWKCHPDA